MEASTGSLDTRLQRTQLKLEGAQNKITDLQRLNADLQRANTDLNNQRERWENLETKGGEAKEMEHKKRVALELELSELKEQYEAQAGEYAKAKKKAENMKDVAANYEVRSSVRLTHIITHFLCRRM
jgi:chromosome segregation ATPase